jgi:hypothetical protein
LDYIETRFPLLLNREYPDFALLNTLGRENGERTADARRTERVNHFTAFLQQFYREEWTLRAVMAGPV